MSTRPILVALASVLLAGGLSAQVTKPWIDAKHQHVIYRADQDTDEVVELYRTDLASGENTKVSGPLVDGGTVWNFAVDPKGRYAAYVADQEVDGLFELFVTEFGSGEVSKLGSALYADVHTSGLRIDSSGRYVVFLGDPPSDPPRLFRADLKTGEIVALVDGLMPWTGASACELGPKLHFAVFTADVETDDVRELFRLKPKTGKLAKLNAPIPEGAALQEFQLDARGRHVYYFVSDLEPGGVTGLFGVGVKKGTAVPLSGAGVDVWTPDYAEALHRRYLVYSATKGAGAHLYRARISTGEIMQLDAPLWEDAVLVQYSWRLDRKGRVAVFLSDRETPDTFQLYRVDLKSGDVVRLNADLVAGGDVKSVELDPKGRFAVYRADQDADNVIEMYRADLSSGEVERLGPTLVAGGDVLQLLLDPDGRHVVYQADQEVGGRNEVYRLDLTTGEVVTLSPPLVTGGDAGSSLVLDESGRYLGFYADAEQDERRDYYVVELETGVLTKVDGQLVDGGDVAF